MSATIPFQYEPVIVQAQVRTLVHVSREQAAICQQHGFRVICTNWDGLLAYAPTNHVIGHPDGSAA